LKLIKSKASISNRTFPRRKVKKGGRKKRRANKIYSGKADY
jgi:hypothetical protein